MGEILNKTTAEPSTASEAKLKPASTSFKVLVLLAAHAPTPMSSFGLGLYLPNDRTNSSGKPQTISVVLKMLAKDKYIANIGKKGARTNLWGLRKRGVRSLQRHIERTSATLKFLRENPNFNAEEQIVLMHLHHEIPKDCGILARETCLKLTDVRKALKDLEERGLIENFAKTENFILNSNGIDANLAIYERDPTLSEIVRKVNAQSNASAPYTISSLNTWLLHIYNISYDDFGKIYH